MRAQLFQQAKRARAFEQLRDQTRRVVEVAKVARASRVGLHARGNVIARERRAPPLRLSRARAANAARRTYIFRRHLSGESARRGSGAL